MCADVIPLGLAKGEYVHARVVALPWPRLHQGQRARMRACICMCVRPSSKLRYVEWSDGGCE